MIQVRLNDAAIKLYQLLDEAKIKHGIFGGFAIGVLGGPRESKDIDCIAATSKKAVIELLHGKAGFRYINQSRSDYVGFLWSDRADRGHAVLVEIFVEQFEGARYPMANVQTHDISVAGELATSGTVSILDPVYIFKGKLRAAATRAKFHDSADIRWLASRAKERLKTRSKSFNLDHVGLAIKRYPELEKTFGDLGIDLTEAKTRVGSVQLNGLPPPRPGDVQSGVLG